MSIEGASVNYVTTAGHRLITHFSFQNHNAVYRTEFVCDVK